MAPCSMRNYWLRFILSLWGGKQAALFTHENKASGAYEMADAAPLPLRPSRYFPLIEEELTAHMGMLKSLKDALWLKLQQA